MKEVWVKARYPGVRFREHRERKYNRQKDRYFTIRYKKDGKSFTEAVGWASHGMNEQKANMMRGEIVQNIREGKQPQSLAEKRQMENERRNAEEREKEQKKQKKVDFNTLAEEFLKWSKANKKDHKNDKSRYVNHIKPVLGDMLAKDISPFILEKLKRDLQKKTSFKNKKRGENIQKLSPKTIHHCLTLIRSIYRKAKTWGLYDGQIPTDKIEFPKLDNKRTRFLSFDETKLLLDELQKISIQVHDQAMMALQCGLRFSEISNLIWADVDFENDVLQIRDSKGGSRPAFITPPVKEILDRLFDEQKSKPNALVIPGKDGRQPHVSSTFYRTVKDLGFNDGITDRRQRVCFHTLRHTFGSWLAIQGTSLYEIMELMGHKDIKMTQRYAHLMPSVKRKAVNKMAETFVNHQKEEKLKNEKQAD